MSTQQYHILVRGFELEKRNSSGDTFRKTDLRHYRYDLDTYTASAENGTWIVRKGKAFVSAFPVANTMILVEEVEAQ